MGTAAPAVLAQAGRITTTDPTEKLARQRVSVLQLAEGLGSVATACRWSKMDRTSFSEWTRRFQLYGLAGLNDLPPVHRTPPQTTPPAVVERWLPVSAGRYRSLPVAAGLGRSRPRTRCGAACERVISARSTGSA